MKKGILWAVVCMFVAVSLVACGGGDGGGGGGGDATTPIGTTISLSEIKNIAEAKRPGTSMSFNMAGSSSTGVNLTGTFSLAISGPTTTTTPTGIQTVNWLEQKVTLTNTSTGATGSTVTYYYYYQTGYLFVILYADLTRSTPTSQTLLPSFAKVGDSGNDMVVVNPDGSTETSTWRIDAGTNGDALFVYAYTNRDSSNVTTSTSEDSYTIKPDGSISSLTSKIYYQSTGMTITLSGNKN